MRLEPANGGPEAGYPELRNPISPLFEFPVHKGQLRFRRIELAEEWSTADGIAAPGRAVLHFECVYIALPSGAACLKYFSGSFVMPIAGFLWLNAPSRYPQ